MSNDKQDGGPAFPSNIHPNNADLVVTGMTLRNYFAAKAMASEIVSQGLEGRDAEHIAGMAYEMSDAMLRERAKP